MMSSHDTKLANLSFGNCIVIYYCLRQNSNIIAIYKSCYPLNWRHSKLSGILPTTTNTPLFSTSDSYHSTKCQNESDQKRQSPSYLPLNHICQEPSMIRLIELGHRPFGRGRNTMAKSLILSINRSRGYKIIKSDSVQTHRSRIEINPYSRPLKFSLEKKELHIF